MSDLTADDISTFTDGRWAEIRERARTTILKDDRFHPAYGLTTEENRARTTEQLAALPEVEYPGLGFPEEFGGRADTGAASVAFEMLAFGDLSLLVKAGVQWGLFGGAILNLGTRHHHETYLPGVLDLSTPGCFAMTETGHGSDVQGLRTTAVFDPETDEFVINTPEPEARKEFIGNAARDGKLAAVFAQLHTADHADTSGESLGVHCLLVPIRDEDGNPMPGVTISDSGRKAGLNGVDNGRLVFDQVRVPRTALLDRYASVARDGSYSSPIESRSRRFFTMLGTLIQGRVSVSGGALSASKTALTIAVRYAERRRQFAPRDSDTETKLLDYATHQRRLLIPLAHTYALGFAQEELVNELHEVFTARQRGEQVDPHRQRLLENWAAGTKAVSTWHATATIQACREACGGAGYLSANRLPSLKADTDVFTTFEGDNVVLLQLLGRGLLTNYRDHFGDLDSLGMVKFVAGSAMDTVIERTTARGLVQRLIDAMPRTSNDQILRHRGWHLQLMESREKHTLDTLARRMRSASSQGMDPEQIANAVAHHLLRAAAVHMDRVVLEAFVAAIDRASHSDDGAAQVEGSLPWLLSKVCDLHVLSTIEADRAWFLEHDQLSPGRSKAIIAEVDELCRELRPYARLLVDGFAIPEEILGAELLSDAQP
ncbi:acyl-CoA dehydrogenase family protein [Microlunatus sp. Y2014]|uniref:acyl-CoA dehydrogenase family protein n=1 Tax=Microlunatus sp. Y2014 TaxID=3418488 RepID=UPI003DA7558C